MRKILDIILTRGTEAFDKFKEALLVTGNGTVADLLKPHLAGTRPLKSGQTGHALPQQETELPASRLIFLFHMRWWYFFSYNFFFMLNSTEHEISTAYVN